MSISKQAQYFYEFGPFRVDVANRLLLRDGAPVPLAPKVWDALFVLVENQGRILEKEELMNRLWPDCFVEEGNLTQIIFQLRKALGESAAKQQYIETIPKRGYRFIAEISVVNGEFEQHLAQKMINKPTNEEKSADNGVLGNGNDVLSPAVPTQSSTEITSAPVQQSESRDHRQKIAMAAAVLLATTTVALSLIFQWFPLRGGSAAPFKKAPLIRKLTSSGKAQQPALSPDGKYVAYVLDEAGRQSIWVRQVNSTSDAQVVPPAEVTYRGMTFSPDGSFIYYVVLELDQPSGTLYQVPVLGGTPRKILAGVDSTVTFSPDGKRFAFVRITAQQKETFLFTANIDGSEEKQLAARKRPEVFSVRGPAWSPDGKIIATPALRDSPGDSYWYIVTVNVANGREARLGSQTWNHVGAAAWLKDGRGVVINAWHQEWPVFANQLWYLSYPDGEVSKVTNDLGSHAGTSIAAQADKLVTGRSERISRLWVAPHGNTNRARLIRSGYGDNYSELFGLHWTHDGRLLYGSHASGNSDIWVMDADGSNQKQLTYDARREICPVGSGDGRYIVFVSQSLGSSYIWRMDADGRNPRQLTHGKFDNQPSLSPDGRWVIYTSFDESGTLSLWKVSIDGGEPTQLTHHTSRHGVVSPNGKLIACEHLDEKSGRMVAAILPFEGGIPIKLFNEIAPPVWGLLRWTPDGSALTYIVNRDGVSNIWLQPINGSQPRQLTNFKEDQIFRLAWSPDGKNLAFDRGETIKDIILISDFR